MHRIGIVYFSQSDITEQLVDAAASAMREKGLDVYLHDIQGQEIIEGRFVNADVFIQLQSCQAIVFASPTYMGGAAAQFKAFADASSELWARQEWAGKFAAGITSGSGLNGDQSATLQYFMTLASQQGMLWMGLDVAHGHSHDSINRLSCQAGVAAQTLDQTVQPSDLATAKYLGQRLAKQLKSYCNDSNNA